MGNNNILTAMETSNASSAVVIPANVSSPAEEDNRMNALPAQKPSMDDRSTAGETHDGEEDTYPDIESVETNTTSGGDTATSNSPQQTAPPNGNETLPKADAVAKKRPREDAHTSGHNSANSDESPPKKKLKLGDETIVPPPAAAADIDPNREVMLGRASNGLSETSQSTSIVSPSSTITTASSTSGALPTDTSATPPISSHNGPFPHVTVQERNSATSDKGLTSMELEQTRPSVHNPSLLPVQPPVIQAPHSGAVHIVTPLPMLDPTTAAYSVQQSNTMPSYPPVLYSAGMPVSVFLATTAASPLAPPDKSIPRVPPDITTLPSSYPTSTAAPAASITTTTAGATSSTPTSGPLPPPPHTAVNSRFTAELEATGEQVVGSLIGSLDAGIIVTMTLHGRLFHGVLQPTLIPGPSPLDPAAAPTKTRLAPVTTVVPTQPTPSQPSSQSSTVPSVDTATIPTVTSATPVHIPPPSPPPKTPPAAVSTATRTAATAKVTPAGTPSVGAKQSMPPPALPSTTASTRTPAVAQMETTAKTKPVVPAPAPKLPDLSAMMEPALVELGRSVVSDILAMQPPMPPMATAPFSLAKKRTQPKRAATQKPTPRPIAPQQPTSRPTAPQQPSKSGTPVSTTTTTITTTTTTASPAAQQAPTPATSQVLLPQQVSAVFTPQKLQLLQHLEHLNQRGELNDEQREQLMRLRSAYAQAYAVKTGSAVTAAATSKPPGAVFPAHPPLRLPGTTYLPKPPPALAPTGNGIRMASVHSSTVRTTPAPAGQSRTATAASGAVAGSVGARLLAASGPTAGGLRSSADAMPKAVPFKPASSVGTAVGVPAGGFAVAKQQLVGTQLATAPRAAPGTNPSAMAQPAASSEAAKGK